MSAANRYEQATDGLNVTSDRGVVLVRDGQTQWLCEEDAWDEMRAALKALPPYPDANGERGSWHAYAELCEEVGGTIVGTGSNGQGTDAEQAALVRRAVAAELLNARAWWVARYLPAVEADR